MPLATWNNGNNYANDWFDFYYSGGVLNPHNPNNWSNPEAYEDYMSSQKNNSFYTDSYTFPFTSSVPGGSSASSQTNQNPNDLDKTTIQTFQDFGKLIVDAFINSAKANADSQYKFNAEQAELNRIFQQMSADKAMKFSADEAQKNRDFQKMMSDTSYQRVVEDLKKAGLNPILAFRNGGSSTPSGSSASSSSASGSMASGSMPTLQTGGIPGIVLALGSLLTSAGGLMENFLVGNVNMFRGKTGLFGLDNASSKAKKFFKRLF